MPKKKDYTKPEIIKIALDNTICLMQVSGIPPDPPPQSSGSKGLDSPFNSPFGDKPFN